MTLTSMPSLLCYLEDISPDKRSWDVSNFVCTCGISRHSRHERLVMNEYARETSAHGYRRPSRLLAMEHFLSLIGDSILALWDIHVVACDGWFPKCGPRRRVQETNVSNVIQVIVDHTFDLSFENSGCRYSTLCFCTTASRLPWAERRIASGLSERASCHSVSRR